MTIVAITLLAAYLAACVYAYMVADQLLFPVPPAGYRDGEGVVKLESRLGDSISALYLPVEGAERLLLYSHGNAEDLGDLRPLLEVFQENGVAALSYDYPGYGTSTGKPTEAGVYAAADAAFQYATGELGFAPEQVVLFGRSLGGGPSTWLAARHPVGGLVLDGAFSSAFRVMTRIRLLPWDKFDNLRRFARINCPVLLIHGTADQVVPFALALQNWEAVRGPKAQLWVEGADHNNLFDLAGSAYWETVLPFVQSPPKLEK